MSTTGLFFEQVQFNSIYTLRPTHALMWNVLNTFYSSLTCFNHYHSHHQGNLQDYKDYSFTLLQATVTVIETCQ